MTTEHSAGDAFGGFGLATKSIQTFATEVARLSKESVEESTQLVEKLRGAKTIEDVVTIQTSFVQQSFAKYADYTRKIGELFTALPLEIAKQSQAIIHKTTEHAAKASEDASQQIQHGAEQISNQVHQATEHVSQQIENVPHHFEPAPQQNFDNHDHNQNHNHDQNYNNNQNYNHDQNYNNNQNYNNDQNYNNQNYNNQNY